DALGLLALAGHVARDAVGAAPHVVEREVLGDSGAPAVRAEDDRRLEGGLGHEPAPMWRRRVTAVPPMRPPAAPAPGRVRGPRPRRPGAPRGSVRGYRAVRSRRPGHRR